MQKYRLIKEINGAKSWVEFEFNDDIENWRTWIDLINWESLWNILDLIKAIWINNKDYFQKIEEQKYDFSDFIYKSNRNVSIKTNEKKFFLNDTRELILSNFTDSERFRQVEWKTPDLITENCTAWELKIWNIFCFMKTIELSLNNFFIVVGKNKNWDLITQFLKDEQWKTIIESKLFNKEELIIKIS